MIFNGKCVSPGVASGKAIVLHSETPLAAATTIPASLPPQGEAERFHAAAGHAAAQLDHVRCELASRGRAGDAAIFATHAAMLEDGELVGQVEARIAESGLSAEAAMATVTLEIYERFLASPHAILSEKAADILDLGQRLLRCLSSPADTDSWEGAIVVASALTPSDLVRFARQRIAAAVVETCGMRSHTAILARGLGIPLTAAVESAVTLIPQGCDVVMDAGAGLVVVNPTEQEGETVESIRQRIRRGSAGVSQPLLEPVTQDGVRILVLLNISHPIEAAAVAQLGADGVGLYRTEFLYLDRPSWPSENESYEIYAQVAKAIGDRELNIRLADFGAEKSPPYAQIQINRNPSLGIRGMRLLLNREDILRPQIKAIARLAQQRPLTLLLPMIDTPDTLDVAVQAICRICECRKRGDLPFRLGIMVEIPSAALLIDSLIEQVDAVSVGLNDLTQYLLAADRDDELVELYHDAMQPAVLRIVKQVIETADSRQKPVSMCGELAGSPELARVLVSLGARRFSISQSHYNGAVALIRKMSVCDLKPLGEELIKQYSGQTVRKLAVERRSHETSSRRPG